MAVFSHIKKKYLDVISGKKICSLRNFFFVVMFTKIIYLTVQELFVRQNIGSIHRHFGILHSNVFDSHELISLQYISTVEPDGLSIYCVLK